MKNVMLGIGLLVAVGAGGWYWLQSSVPQSADASNAQLVTQGKGVYVDNCASCHGENLEGQPNWRDRDDEGYLPAPPHDQTGHTWHHADQLLFQITKDGTASIAPGDYKTNMMGFGESLSDTEIWAVLAYIKSTWPEKERTAQARINRQSQPKK
jgi:mono/diheme cytochrome c family protein